jgi:hypothetical protein
MVRFLLGMEGFTVLVETAKESFPSVSLPRDNASWSADDAPP